MLDNRGGTSAIKRLYSNLTADYRFTDLSFAIADYVSFIVSLCECPRDPVMTEKAATAVLL